MRFLGSVKDAMLVIRFVDHVRGSVVVVKSVKQNRRRFFGRQ